MKKVTLNSFSKAYFLNWILFTWSQPKSWKAMNWTLFIEIYNQVVINFLKTHSPTQSHLHLLGFNLTVRNEPVAFALGIVPSHSAFSAPSSAESHQLQSALNCSAAFPWFLCFHLCSMLPLPTQPGVTVQTMAAIPHPGPQAADASPPTWSKSHFPPSYLTASHPAWHLEPGTPSWAPPGSCCVAAAQRTHTFMTALGPYTT